MNIVHLCKFIFKALYQLNIAMLSTHIVVINKNAVISCNVKRLS